MFLFSSEIGFSHFKKFGQKKLFVKSHSTSNGLAIEKSLTQIRRPTEDCREKVLRLDGLPFLDSPYVFKKKFQNYVIIF